MSALSRRPRRPGSRRSLLGRAVLWRWLVGETTPHIDSAAEIEQLTGIPSRLWAKNPAFRMGAPLVDVPDDAGSEAA